MRTSFRRLSAAAAAAAAVILSIMLSAAAPGFAQTAPPEAKGTSAVKGRVISNDGKGVEGVTVVLLSSDRTSERKPAGRATSDPDGGYTMTGVAAGRYYLQAIAPAHVVNDLPNNHTWGGGSNSKVLNLSPGETVENQTSRSCAAA